MVGLERQTDLAEQIQVGVVVEPYKAHLVGLAARPEPVVQGLQFSVTQALLRHAPAAL